MMSQNNLEENNYIGITLGPIFNTINMTSSPAGLWAASYMFSFLTRTICKKLIEKGVKPTQIISPYYNSENDYKKDGVGRYHDHIIVRSDNNIPSLEAVSEVISQAKNELKTLFSIDSSDTSEEIFPKESLSTFINDYIKIAAFRFSRNDSETAIFASSDMFNCIELSVPIMPPSETNPLLSFFDNRENDKILSDHKNELIKKSQLVRRETNDEWQLLDGKKIKTLEDIAKSKRTDGLKPSEYYVILRSDGDSISKVIQTCRDDSSIRSFSKRCIEYCNQVAQTVRKYGGVTIYSGGDDLLAIVPAASFNKAGSERYENIFDLISRITYDFSEAFNEPVPYTEPDGSPHRFDEKEKDFYNENIKPTISFGAAVCYCKFPLYEALQLSADMLFDIAKRQTKTEQLQTGTEKTVSDKNYTAITFRKHSGKTETLLIKNTSMKTITALFDRIYSDETKSSEFLSSISHKLYDFDKLFAIAHRYGSTAVKNVFENTFDSEIHTNNEFIFKDCVNLFTGLYAHDEAHLIYALSTLSASKKDQYDEDILRQSYCGSGYYRELDGINVTFDYIFRIIKFFGEKAGREAKNE